MAVANKRRKLDQQKPLEVKVPPPDSLLPSHRFEDIRTRDQGSTISSGRIRKGKQLQTSTAQQSTTQWSPTRNGYLAIPLKVKPTSPRRNLVNYTQYLDSLAVDVDEKCEQSVRTANGVTNLDWRIKEVLEDGSSHESQHHGGDDLDDGTRGTPSKAADLSSTTASSTSEDQAT